MAQVSLLFVVWSLVGFACEVPSGAWADTHDRRQLLVWSAVVQAGGFAVWLLRPTFTGFALGFVAWGVSSALMSGTFESLLYDELRAQQRVRSYARLLGWARSSAMVANLAAAGMAALLFPLGGYALVGWASVASGLVQAVLAATLPVSPAARRPHGDGSVEHAVVGYLAMLRSGLAEVRGHPPVRRATVLAGLMVGFTAYDEYFPLVARDHGVATRTVPLLIALTVVGQVAGTVSAAGVARLSRRSLGAIEAVGALLVSVGALATPYAGFVAIALGYGLLNAAMLAGETRVQDVITGPARATVTSVLGVLAEVVALTVYGAFAILARAAGFPLLVALLGIPVVLVAAAVVRWLPAREDS